METEDFSLHGTSSATVHAGRRPADVLVDKTLSKADKRAILASWASDARAVEDAPALRQLDDHSLVDIDQILEALKRLDDIEETTPVAMKRPDRHRVIRWRPRRWIGHRDDDDDPPPCPAAAMLTRPVPILGGAAVAPVI